MIEPTDKTLLIRWRKNFTAGLFLVLPAVISFAVIKWLFGTVSTVTDLLLFFADKRYTHEATAAGPGTGPMHWYWSLAALAVGVLLVSAVGRLARNYMGKKVIEWAETVMMRIPLFNKIYGSVKQVNDAFTVGGANSFKTVVRVEFPQAGSYTIGFLTSEADPASATSNGDKLVSVFIPTTPNPTSGFLVLVPEAKITRLEMSVADGVKYIVSLGSVMPEAGHHGQGAGGKK